MVVKVKNEYILITREITEIFFYFFVHPSSYPIYYYFMLKGYRGCCKMLYLGIIPVYIIFGRIFSPDTLVKSLLRKCLSRRCHYYLFFLIYLILGETVKKLFLLFDGNWRIFQKYFIKKLLANYHQPLKIKSWHQTSAKLVEPLLFPKQKKSK